MIIDLLRGKENAQNVFTSAVNRTLMNTHEEIQIVDTINDRRNKLTGTILRFIAAFFIEKKINRVFLMSLLLIASASFTQAQTLTSDQADYPPGSTVTLIGSGFLPGETVTLKVTHADGTFDNDTSAAHQPWTVTADGNGGFKTTWVVPADQDELGALLLATADGVSSKRHAETTFTDQASFKSIGVGSQNPALTYGANGSTNYDVTVGFVGNNSTVSVQLSYAFNSGTPAGIASPSSSHFSVNPAVSTGNDVHSTLSIVSDGTTPVGSYTFTVSGNDGAGTTNKGTGTLTITKATTVITSVSGTGIYGGNAVLTAKANLNVSGLPVDFSINGTPVGTANTNATGLASLTVNFSSIPNAVRNAGTYTGAQGISASISNSTNYTAATALGDLSISKADQTITWSDPADITFGTLLSATQLNATVSGVTGGSPTGGLTYSPAAGTLLNAGNSQTLHVAAAATNNYNAASKDVSINVKKANALITITPYVVVYNGTSYTATGTATGVESTPADLSALLTLTSTTHTNAADYPADAWTFAGNGNYNGASGTVHDIIDKAEAHITVNAYHVIYDGDTHAATGTALGVEASPVDLSSLLTLNGTRHSNAGTYTGDVWSFAGNNNYNAATGTVNDEITRRPITIYATMGQYKYCGQSDPVFTYSYSPTSNSPVQGLAATDQFSGALSRNSGEVVNTYNILLAGLTIKNGLSDVSNNYQITYNPATFEIKGVLIDASQSSTAIPLGTASTTLIAMVTNSTNSPVGNDQVSFTVTNGSNVSVAIVSNVLTDGSGKAVITLSLPSSSFPVGLYKVTAVSGGGCATAIAYFPIYDPNAGFVTGGGWITSPIVSESACPSCVFMRVTGKANFGFNAQYKKGSNSVDGNTQFQFQEGNLNFKSSSYSTGSLVIAGAKAIFKGTGTINGSGNYGFMVSAIDGSLNGGGGTDKFRIKIWEVSTGNIVYDNNYGSDENADPATVLGGGSIVIHSTNAKSTSTTTAVAATLPSSQSFNVKVMNNPSLGGSDFKLAVESDSKEEVSIIVTSMYGEKVFNAKGAANTTYRFGANWRSGTYIIQVIQGKNEKTFKVIKGEG